MPITTATLLAVTAVLAPAAPVQGPARDTVKIEVGSPIVDGRVFEPHAARVRIYRGDTLTAEWVNELTLGDSAGRRVMRWVTTSVAVPSNPGRPLSVLRQTYDAATLAPLGYWSEANNGNFIRLAIDGGRIRGVRKTASDTAPVPVDRVVPRLGFMAGASDLVPVAAGLRTGTVLLAPVWSPGMASAEDRVFAVLADTTVIVEGNRVRARKVDERRLDGSLFASWYLLRSKPYMVYGEVPLPDGRVQRMTEVPVP